MRARAHAHFQNNLLSLVRLVSERASRRCSLADDMIMRLFGALAFGCLVRAAPDKLYVCNGAVMVMIGECVSKAHSTSTQTPPHSDTPTKHCYADVYVCYALVFCSCIDVIVVFTLDLPYSIDCASATHTT